MQVGASQSEQSPEVCSQRVSPLPKIPAPSLSPPDRQGYFDIKIRYPGASVTVWDPIRYLEFADERSRPFVELLSRVHAADPKLVVDLGCGPGQLTASLAQRWPRAQILGLSVP